jgi:adenylate cyclase
LALGQSLSLRGQLDDARQHLAQVPVLYDAEADRPLGLVFLGAPSIMARALLGYTLWLLGYPEQGQACLQQALRESCEPGKSSSAAFIRLVWALACFLLARDPTAARRHSDALRELGKASGVYGTWNDILTCLERRAAEGAEAENRPTFSFGVGQACQQLIRAQMLAQTGQAGLALEMVNQAQAWIEQTGVRMMAVEVYRMRGELLLALAPGNFSEAEQLFRQALEVARAQQARWLELRAAVSLARLWQAHGRGDDARELLAGVTAWFTEGYDLADLVEARECLEWI